MRTDATDRLLKTVQRRLWLQGLADRGWSGLLWAAGLLGLAAALHTFHTSLPVTWWSSAALLAVGAALAAAAVNRPTLESAASAADRWLDTHQLFSAARYLRASTAGVTTTAARVVLERAERTAADAPGRLPRIRNPGQPLSAVMAIAVAASSLFFLSLQGAPPAGQIPGVPGGPIQVQGPVQEDGWLSVLNAGLAAESTVSDNAPTAQNTNAAASATGTEPGYQSGDVPDAAEPGERRSGPAEWSNIRQSVQGSGAGRLASMAPSRPVPGNDDYAGAAAPGKLQIVAVPREPAGQANAVDRSVSVGLQPVSGAPARRAAVLQAVIAARLAGQTLAPDLGPAHRALQARYFEEIAPDD